MSGNIKRRLGKLEEVTGAVDAEPRYDLVAESSALDAWLAREGLTQREVLVRDIPLPAGIQTKTLQIQLQAIRDLMVLDIHHCKRRIAEQEQRAEKFSDSRIVKEIADDVARLTVRLAELEQQLAEDIAWWAAQAIQYPFQPYQPYNPEPAP